MGESGGLYYSFGKSIMIFILIAYVWMFWFDNNEHKEIPAEVIWLWQLFVPRCFQLEQPLTS